MPNACTGAGGRGCACAWHARQRVRQRRYAAKQREKKLAERQGTDTRCKRRAGSYECGGRLEPIVLPGGATTWACPLCARRKAGICRDCPLPVHGTVGRALRCKVHTAIARRESIAASHERHLEANRERSRKHYQSDPDVRARRNEYKRLWRKANRDKVREQKKRYVERQRENPNSRYNRYHARYRKQHDSYSRTIQKERRKLNRAAVKPPACTKCGKKTGWKPVPGMGGQPWTTCNKCCWPHQLKERRAARRRALRELREAEQAPVKVKPPRQPATLGPGLERLCITPGCDIVVAHRKKKCTKCLRRDAELAQQLLANHRGRGRRTDLQREVRYA